VGLSGPVNTTSRYARDEGIVIKRTEFSEMDLILTLFTRRRGKFQVIARGARKLGNRFGASLDLFNFCEFFLYTASGMTNLVQAKVERSFRDLLERREKWISGEYLLYLVDKVFEFERPEESILEELLGLWEKMLALQDAQLKCYLLTLRFRVVLLLFSGVSPQFSVCVQCGRKIGHEESFLSLSRGGRLCRECRDTGEEVLLLSPFLGAVLGYVFSSPCESILKLSFTVDQFRALDELVSLYLSYHLEKKIFPLGYFLEQMRKIPEIL